jgi:predicted SnoaL-like aldol condensation-catalyzing enzyme
MGIPPGGRTVTISGVDVHRLRDGRMAEHWHVIEELQMLP